MRNLKRALSLAVSTVMLIGMMAVGTSAASYADVTSEHNTEAIEVMQAVSVMVGDENGNFNPDKNVTRAEMAVVMANLLDLQVEDFVGASIPFTDVPEWARAYVAACYADGITGGISATEYGSNYSVTATQAALMILKALGYFQYSSDFGTDWQVTTVRQASQIKLFDGIDSARNAAMTRNEVAQIALNALKARLVEPTGSTGGQVTTGDTTIIIGGNVSYEYVTSTDNDINTAISADQNKDNEYYLELGEQRYDGDLTQKTIGNVRDDLGRPAHKWTYPNGTTEVGTYADEADYVVTATKAYTGLNALYQDEVDEDYPNTSIAYQQINGRDWKSGDKDDEGNWIASGDVVEFYLNDAGTVTDAVTLRYSVAKVADVNTRVTSSDAEDGISAYIRLEELDGTSLGARIDDVDFADFNYDEDDVILVVMNEAKTEVLASELAESVTGEITAIRGGEVRIDGVYYKDVQSTKSEIGDDGTFYLNKAGQIVAADATSTESDNYIWLYAIDGDYTRNSDGIQTAVFTGYGVLTDGTKVSYEIATDAENDDYYFEGADKSEDTKLGSLSGNSVTVSKKSAVIAYSVNSDDQLVYEDAADTIKWQRTHDTVDKENAKIGDAYATSDTVFIFGDIDDTGVDVSLSTGYRNVDIKSSASLTTIADEDGNALYVFVKAANGSLSSDDMYAVLLDEDAVVTKEDGDTFYTYTVYTDGQETELTWKTSSNPLSGYTIGDVFKYNMDGEYVDTVEKQVAVSVTAATSDYVIANNAQYNMEDAVIHTIVRDYDNKGEIDTVDAYEGGSIEAKDNVILVVDGNSRDVVTAFVYDDIK